VELFPFFASAMPLLKERLVAGGGAEAQTQ
jgi:hypothetical protein